MSLHTLKTWPKFFSAVRDGTKTFEARKNDRGFEVGDVLDLREWDPISGFTGRNLTRYVSYMLKGPGFGVEAGHVIMALSVQP